ncbi:MAG: M3 family oligoendopeptidase [Fimbriimonadales bacterium]|nr:M3 family oligoendopeptidase [Fimbriimonadales bacterium]
MEPAAAPRWNLESVFPSLDSAEFVEAKRAMLEHLDALCGLYDAEKVGRAGHCAPDRLEAVLRETNAYLESSRTVGVYVSLHVAADSRNPQAQAVLSELSKTQAKLTKLMVRLTAWLKGADIAALSGASDYLKEYRHHLSRLSVLAERLMSEPEEDLYAELQPSAGIAWGKLHGNVTSTLEVEVELATGARRLSMSQVRNLAFSPDRSLRRAAYEAELRAWRNVETTMAACLNGIKGEVLVVARRRGWTDPLEESLFAAGIDQSVLDAMMGAARDSFPMFRRYLRAKARALGLDRLAWYDLFAPVGEEREWSFSEAERFILGRFAEYGSRMEEMARRAFEERWVDAEPRLGKRDGAFCASLRADESRILMNFKPSFGSVSTLAHELGHAYHNVCLSERDPLLRNTPMTLAETASIFCETLVRQAAMGTAEGPQRLSLLEASLQGACQTVVDISSRVLFEQEVFRGREAREWNASELCELMLSCQEETYGEGLDADARHPYMWAVKPHYYSASRSFYNFPYLFGHLFGLGLYRRYCDDPEAFRAGYDELLSSTGMAPAMELAERFGIDLRNRAFWESSLSVIEREVAEFERLVSELEPC